MVSDESLLERLKAGHLDAFDALYERHERGLLGFIDKHLRDRHDAEDVLHESFLALLRDSGSGPAGATLRAWLYQVARNLCLNRRRSRERAERANASAMNLPAESGELPERTLEHRERTDALRRGISQLPVNLAEVYQLRSQGMSYDEMARVLSVPLGTVKSRMHEMVSRLKEEINR